MKSGSEASSKGIATLSDVNNNMGKERRAYGI